MTPELAYFLKINIAIVYREIFPEGSFERKGHYEDAKGNAIALTGPKKQDSRENGVHL